MSCVQQENVEGPGLAQIDLTSIEIGVWLNDCIHVNKLIVTAVYLNRRWGRGTEMLLHATLNNWSNLGQSLLSKGA